MTTLCLNGCACAVCYPTVLATVADDIQLCVVSLRNMCKMCPCGLLPMKMLHCRLILQPHSSRLCWQTTQPSINILCHTEPSNLFFYPKNCVPLIRKTYRATFSAPSITLIPPNSVLDPASCLMQMQTIDIPSFLKYFHRTIPAVSPKFVPSSYFLAYPVDIRKWQKKFFI